MTASEFEAMRRMFPEIPKCCKRVLVEDNGYLEPMTITVEFYPSIIDGKDVRTGEFVIIKGDA